MNDASPPRPLARERGAEAVVLPGTERSVGLARRWLREVVGTGHPALYECALCVTELMTNALRHTASGLGGKIRVEVVVGPGRIRAEVTDEGVAPPQLAGEGAVPHVRMTEGTDEDGRGLLIVAACATEWGVRRMERGCTVWFTLEA